MTRTCGYYIRAAPCCGTSYRAARYRSVNFMSSAIWTDGYRENSLMPNDHGLRRCKCGNYFLQSELVTISEADETDEPLIPRLPPEDLPTAITQARTQAIELAARLDYWQHLNHRYRNQYRAHREAEDAATEAAWETSNPDRRTTWQKLLKKNRKPRYQPALDRPITFPEFEPSPEQRANMLALLNLIESSANPDLFQQAELNRELGQFEEARRALSDAKEEDDPSLYRLIEMLIARRQAAPVRYAA
jgi:hypothetical protein